jgi:hypothetical protein
MAMKLKIGEVIEAAIWLNGEETHEMRLQFALDLRAGLESTAAENGVAIGPFTETIKRPGDDRVPPVPDNVQGIDVRLLVFEATVIGAALADEGNFIAELEPSDLERLRQIARRAFARLNPDKPPLSIERCDEFINQNGPDIALAALRQQVGDTIH